MALGNWQVTRLRVERLKALVEREKIRNNQLSERRKLNVSKSGIGGFAGIRKMADRYGGFPTQRMAREPLGPPAPYDPAALMQQRAQSILGTEPPREPRFDIPHKSFGERLATSKLLTESVLGESAGERVRSIPVVGPALERNVLPLTTVPGLAATAAFPAATLYGAGAATAASLAGQAAEEHLGAPENIVNVGPFRFGTRGLAELGAGVYGGPGGGVKRGAPAVEEAAQRAGRTIEETGGIAAQPGRFFGEEVGGTRLPGGSEFDNAPSPIREGLIVQNKRTRALFRLRKVAMEGDGYTRWDAVRISPRSGAMMPGRGKPGTLSEKLIRVNNDGSLQDSELVIKGFGNDDPYDFRIDPEPPIPRLAGSEVSTATNDLGQPRLPSTSSTSQATNAPPLTDRVSLGTGEPPPPDVPTTAGEPPTRTYVADMRQLAPEDVGVEGVAGKVVSKTGIDPSAGALDPVSKIAIAFNRQMVAAKNLATVAVDAALEPFYGPLGRMPFRINNEARITNLVDGESTAWMDVFSNPTAYNLTPDQKAYVDRFLQVVRETEEMRVANGLAPRSVEEAVEDVFYVPRQVLGARGVEFTRASKASLQRQHEFAEGGIEAGARYDRDPLRTLKFHVSAAYDEVAGKQLADSLEPFSQPPSVVRPGESGELARATQGAPGELFGREGQIPVKLWRNRFFPKEQAEFLEKIVDPRDTQNWVSAAFGKAGNYVRFLSASLDFAAPFIHGLPLMGNDPRRWTQATWRHYNAFFDPSVRARYMADNLEDFQEMARYGIPVNEHEFFKAIQEGGGISARGVPGIVRRPVIAATRQTFGRGQAAFDTFAAVARHQLWVGLKDAVPDAVERATLIRNMTGGQVTSALGVKAGQAGFESSFLAFSPALLRSTASLFVKAAQPNTPAGRQALRSLLTLASGAAATYVALGKALGKSDEEIKTGLDPTQGKKFLSYKVGQDWVGLGGQVRAMVQLAAGVGSAVAPGGKPVESLISNDMRDNPIGQAYLSRGAVGLSLGGTAIEGLSGGNLNTSPYENPSNIQEAAQTIGTSALPFSLQGALEGQAPGTVAAGFFGMRTSRETRWEALTGAWKELYPDTPFNLTAARSDPALANEVQDWERDRRSKETPSAIKAVKVEGARANLEVESGLATQPDGTKGLAGEFLSGNTEVGPAIIEAYDELQDKIDGVFEATYLDSGDIKPTTKDEEILQQLQGMNSKVAPYRNFQTGEIDYDKLDADRAKLVRQLSTPTRKAYEGFVSRAVDGDLKKLEPQLKKARELRGNYYELDRWKPEVKNQDKIQEIHDEVDLIRLELNDAGMAEVPATRLYNEYRKRNPGYDPETVATAYRLRSGDRMVNPERFEFLRDNESLLKPFFPNLYSGSTRAKLAPSTGESRPGGFYPIPTPTGGGAPSGFYPIPTPVR